MQNSLLSSLNLVKMDKLFNQDFSKPPDLKMVTNIPQTLFNRSSGNYKKVPEELQYMAEEALIMKTHKEFPCKLPDVPRSTFLMVFSPDGTKVASTHGNHNVYVTELTSKRNVRTLSGHPRTPWCIAFHPSSNQILASGCLGGQVRVWDLHGGSEIWMTESQTVIASLAFHPTDRLLVIASYNEVLFWDWSCPAPFAKSTTINEKEKVRFVGFDPLGHKLLTGVANAPQRIESQWNRTPAPPPPPPPAPPDEQEPFQNDYERRIIVCYRFMVQQYEQLVHRYRLLIRARSGSNSSIAGGSTSSVLGGGDSPSTLRRRTPASPGGARTIRRFRSSHPLPTRSTLYHQLATRLRPAMLRLSDRRVPGSLFSTRVSRGVVSNPVAQSSSRDPNDGDGTMLQQFESEITESLARLHRNIRRMRIHMPWESESRDARSTSMNHTINVDTSDSDVDIETAPPVEGAGPPSPSSPHSARITVVPNPSGNHSWRQRDPFSYVSGRGGTTLDTSITDGAEPSLYPRNPLLARLRNRMNQTELRRIYLRATRLPVFGPRPGAANYSSFLLSEQPTGDSGTGNSRAGRLRGSSGAGRLAGTGNSLSISVMNHDRDSTAGSSSLSLLTQDPPDSVSTADADTEDLLSTVESLSHLNQSEDSRAAVVSVMGVARDRHHPAVSRMMDLTDYLATTEDVIEPTGPFLRATTYSIRQFFGNMQATYNVIALGGVTSHCLERLNFLYEHYATNRSFQSVIQLARHLHHASIMCRARFVVVKAAQLDRRWSGILQQLTRFSAFHPSPSNTTRSEASAEFFQDLDRNGRLLEVCFGALAEGSSQEYDRNIFDNASLSSYEEAARRLQRVLLRHIRWASSRLDVWSSLRPQPLRHLSEIAEQDAALHRELLALDVMAPELTQGRVRAVRDEFVDTLIQDMSPPILEDTLMTCIRRFASLSSRMDDIITQELNTLPALPAVDVTSSVAGTSAMFSEDESTATESEVIEPTLANSTQLGGDEGRAGPSRGDAPNERSGGRDDPGSNRTSGDVGGDGSTRIDRTSVEDVARSYRTSEDVSGSNARTSAGVSGTSRLGGEDSRSGRQTGEEGLPSHSRDNREDVSTRSNRTTGGDGTRSSRSSRGDGGRGCQGSGRSSSNRASGDGNARRGGDRKLLRRARQQRFRPAYRQAASSSSSEDDMPVVHISGSDSDNDDDDDDAPSTSRPNASSTSDLLRRLKALARTTGSESAPDRRPVDLSAPSTSSSQAPLSSESSSFSNIMQSVREFITQLETLVGPGRNSRSRASNMNPSSSSTSTPSSSSSSSLNTSATSTPEGTPASPSPFSTPLSAFVSGICRKRKLPPDTKDASSESLARRRRHTKTEPTPQDHAEASSSTQPDECSCWFRAAVDNSPGTSQTPTPTTTTACPLDKHSTSQTSASQSNSWNNLANPSAVNIASTSSANSSSLPSPSQPPSSPAAVSQEPLHDLTINSSSNSLDDEILAEPTSPLYEEVVETEMEPDVQGDHHSPVLEEGSPLGIPSSPIEEGSPRDVVSSPLSEETLAPPRMSEAPPLPEEAPPRIPEAPPTPTAWESVRFLRVPRARPWESCTFPSNARVPSPSRIGGVEMLRVPSQWDMRDTTTGNPYRSDRQSPLERGSSTSSGGFGRNIFSDSHSRHNAAATASNSTSSSSSGGGLYLLSRFLNPGGGARGDLSQDTPTFSYLGRSRDRSRSRERARHRYDRSPVDAEITQSTPATSSEPVPATSTPEVPPDRAGNTSTSESRLRRLILSYSQASSPAPDASPSNRLSDNPRFRSGDFQWEFMRSLTPRSASSPLSSAGTDATLSASIAEASRRIDDSLFRLRNSSRAHDSSGATPDRPSLLTRASSTRTNTVLTGSSRTISATSAGSSRTSVLRGMYTSRPGTEGARSGLLSGMYASRAGTTNRTSGNNTSRAGTGSNRTSGDNTSRAGTGSNRTSSPNNTRDPVERRRMTDWLHERRLLIERRNSQLSARGNAAAGGSDRKMAFLNERRRALRESVSNLHHAMANRSGTGIFRSAQRGSNVRASQRRTGHASQEVRARGAVAPAVERLRLQKLRYLNTLRQQLLPGEALPTSDANWARGETVGADWSTPTAAPDRPPPPPPPASTLPSATGSRGTRARRRGATSTSTSDPERTRMVKARSQARHILAMMLRHISSFFQNANLLDVPSHQDQQESFFFHERVYNLHRLLQLALHLTELLYAQLSLSRHLLDNLRSSLNSVTRLQSLLRHRQASFRPSRGPLRLTRESSVPISVLSQSGSTSQEQQSADPASGADLPQVHLNDIPLPSPPSPPSYYRSLGGGGARFLHPRHVTPATARDPWDDDEPTVPERAGTLGSNVFLMRGAYGPNSILVPDSYYSPHHRIQAWDFARSNIPDIWNSQKNIVVKECKIHNDASVDISKDGQILVTLLPSGRLSVTTMLGVYSLHWSTLGQCLYTTSFELNAVSVSLSPTSRHLIVGLASRRVSLSNFADTHTIAQIFRLEGGVAGTSTDSPTSTPTGEGKEPPPGGRKGRLVQLRHIELPRDTGYMSLNCIRWAPTPGQGLVYGTNTGLLRILE